MTASHEVAHPGRPRHKTAVAQIVGLAAVLAAAATGCGDTTRNVFPAASQPSAARATLSPLTEDITFITGGRFADHFAVLDSKHVVAVPLSGATPFTLFRLLDTDTGGELRGITYLESENAFALSDADRPDALLVVDSIGRQLDLRQIQYPNGAPRLLEGLASIPSSASFFPEHLLLVAWHFVPQLEIRIEVLRTDGAVVQEIVPQDPLRSAQVSGITFKLPEERILVSTAAGEVFTLELDGTVTSGPATITGASPRLLEGLVQLPAPDLRIAAATLEDGRIFLHDSDLVRLPAQDLDYPKGLGVPAHGVAFSPTTGDLLLALGTLGSGSFDGRAELLAASPLAVDAARTVLDLAAAGLPVPRRSAFLPDEGRVAMILASSTADIALVDEGSGALEERFQIPGLGRLSALAYNPVQHELLLVELSKPQRIQVVPRPGTTPSRTIDVSALGLQLVHGLTYFSDPDTGEGRLLILDAGPTHRAVVTGPAGGFVRELNMRTQLGLLAPFDVAAISTGPLAGSFAALDGAELVFFRLDGR